MCAYPFAPPPFRTRHKKHPLAHNPLPYPTLLAEDLSKTSKTIPPYQSYITCQKSSHNPLNDPLDYQYNIVREVPNGSRMRAPIPTLTLEKMNSQQTACY